MSSLTLSLNDLPQARKTKSKIIFGAHMLLSRIKRIKNIRPSDLLKPFGFIGYACCISSLLLYLSDDIIASFSPEVSGDYRNAACFLLYIAFAIILIGIVLRVLARRDKAKEQPKTVSRPVATTNEKKAIRQMKRMTGECSVFISRPATIDVVLYDCCRCVTALSLGREHPLANDYRDALNEAHKNGSWDEFLKEVEPLAKRRRDLAKIWQSSFGGLLDLSLLVSIDNQDTLKNLARNWNVDLKLDAYYEGVPVEHIVVP